MTFYSKQFESRISYKAEQNTEDYFAQGESAGVSNSLNAMK